jgi:hypothetical protein
LRVFIKSTISESDYSEWFIGHNGSTYYRKTEKEKAEIFRKIEPYLTFLDYSELEAGGADVDTKLQENNKAFNYKGQRSIILLFYINRGNHQHYDVL